MKPHFVIYDRHGLPYLKRWWLIPRNRWLNVYLHKFESDDDDRALHDHPWHSLSLCLSGGYWEIVRHGISQAVMHRRKPWRLVYRRPETAHRIVLHRNADGSARHAWTLFLTGPKVREWGFHFRSGWRPWHEAVEPDNPGKMRGGIE